MKKWKRYAGMAVSLFFMVGLLVNDRMIVDAGEAADAVPVGAWVSDGSGDPAAEAAQPDELLMPAEEILPEQVDSRAETVAHEFTPLQAEPVVQAEDGAAEGDAEECEWRWDETFNEAGTDITEVKAAALYQGKEYPAAVTQGELKRAADCIWPAQYLFTAVAVIDGREVRTEEVRGFGHIPEGHDLGVQWKLNTEDVAYPYYDPVCSDTCLVCGQQVKRINEDFWTVSGGDAACDREIPVFYRYSYQTVFEDGEESRPFTVDSGELMLPATGVHSFMAFNDLPGWNWSTVSGGDNRWTAQATFWCGWPHDSEVIYTEEDKELTVTSVEQDGVTTWTATLEGKFYNYATGHMDREVKLSSFRKVTQNGFDISGVSDVYYTGDPVTFDELEVRYGEYRLTEGTDYTVKYKNNRNAGNASVTVTGKGRYKGSVTLPFRILPVDLGTWDFYADDVYVVGNGKSQKIKAPLYWNGKKVASSACTYEFADDCRAAGDHRVTIRAKTGKKSNFTGATTYWICISEAGQKNLVAGSQISVHLNREYAKYTLYDEFDYGAFEVPRNDQGRAGNPPAYTLTWKNKDVTEAADWSFVQIDDRIGLGMVYVGLREDVEIQGCRFFGQLVYYFPLDMPAIDTCRIDLPAEIPYPGRAITPWVLRDEGWLKIVDLKGKVYDDAGQVIEGAEMELWMDDSYDVTIKNGTKAGNMKVTITGRRGYSGSKTCTVKVTKPDLKDMFVGQVYYDPVKDEDVFVDADKGSFPYTKGGAVIQDLRVGIRRQQRDWEGNLIEGKYYLEDLMPGRDYTVKYSGNKQAGATATLTVSGKGNYTGSKSITFTVRDRDMENREDYFNELAALVQDVLPAAGARNMKPYMAGVEVYDRITGKKLQEKKDYTLKYYYYSDKGRTEFNASTGTDAIDGLGSPGFGFEVEILGKEGSGFTGCIREGYRVVKKLVKPADFKVKDQVLPIDRYGNLRQDYYFIHPEETDDPDHRQFDPWIADDAFFGKWVSAYFSEAPAGTRFRVDPIFRADKAGMATAYIRLLHPEVEGKEPDCSVGGYVKVQFKVANKDLVR